MPNPALPQLLEVLWSMRIYPDITMLEVPVWPLGPFARAHNGLRRRLRIASGSQADTRLESMMRELLTAGVTCLGAGGSEAAPIRRRALATTHLARCRNRRKEYACGCRAHSPVSDPNSPTHLWLAGDPRSSSKHFDPRGAGRSHARRASGCIRLRDCDLDAPPACCDGSCAAGGDRPVRSLRRDAVEADGSAASHACKRILWRVGAECRFAGLAAIPIGRTRTGRDAVSLRGTPA